MGWKPMPPQCKCRADHTPLRFNGNGVQPNPIPRLNLSQQKYIDLRLAYPNPKHLHPRQLRFQTFPQLPKTLGVINIRQLREKLFDCNFHDLPSRPAARGNLRLG